MSNTVRRCTSNCKIRDTCLPNELSIYTHLRVRMRTCCIKRSSRKSYGNVSIHSASKRMQFCADFWTPAGSRSWNDKRIRIIQPKNSTGSRSWNDKRYKKRSAGRVSAVAAHVEFLIGVEEHFAIGLCYPN
uniref:Uncharacterized protein n=1 Tax=Glossina pallidipes TaxID=7398 RepID=A0A1B0A2E0_GLOPL